MGNSSYGKFDKRIYTDLCTDHPIDLTRYQVLNCYSGRSGLINSGGASTGADDMAQAVRTAVINKHSPKCKVDKKTIFHINPTGRFEVGGPHGDSGLTGRGGPNNRNVCCANCRRCADLTSGRSTADVDVGLAHSRGCSDLSGRSRTSCTYK
jgi:hypothetical protein